MNYLFISVQLWDYRFLSFFPVSLHYSVAWLFKPAKAWLFCSNISDILPVRFQHCSKASHNHFADGGSSLQCVQNATSEVWYNEVCLCLFCSVVQALSPAACFGNSDCMNPFIYILESKEKKYFLLLMFIFGL